ncbi:MAG: RhuM family protein [Rikenellaceae bacterium]
MENNIIIYQAVDGTMAIDVKFESETIWLTQKQIAELFGVKVPAINKHLKKIFAEGELIEEVVVSKMEITTQHGAIQNKSQVRQGFYYNLDAILSVGYRVNSKNATQFRIWANKVLKEHLLKGYSIKDNIKLQQFEQLKNTKHYGYS